MYIPICGEVSLCTRMAAGGLLQSAASDDALITPPLLFFLNICYECNIILLRFLYSLTGELYCVSAVINYILCNSLAYMKFMICQ